ncbi:MAG: hypothetical protein IKI30_07715 [Oxalobacter sp.]|nr:hypothetical protein [Oxalobacter sp.]
MEKGFSLWVILLMGIAMTACNAGQPTAPKAPAGNQERTVQKMASDENTAQSTAFVMRDKAVRKMALSTGDLNFTFDTEDNETVRALGGRFPLKLKMADLNGNEKYAYLSEPLPAKPESVGRIKAGDVMLFGDNCLVVFYKDFETSYRYTRIGHIGNSTLLTEALGSGDVEVTFGR